MFSESYLLKILFYQLIVYTADQRRLGCSGYTNYEKNEEITIFRTMAGGCQGNENKIIQVAINIPIVPPSENLMKVIKVSYLIRVSIVIFEQSIIIL